MTNYNAMDVRKLKKVYLEKAGELNKYIDKFAPNGVYNGEKVDKIDVRTIPTSKFSLITKIVEMDIQFSFGDQIESSDDSILLTVGETA
ncbi:MAG: hypothetical protein WC781_04885 [Candidatus Pacearchaeota archaeon]|jgi:hypothetical protein